MSEITRYEEYNPTSWLGKLALWYKESAAFAAKKSEIANDFETKYKSDINKENSGTINALKTAGANTLFNQFSNWVYPESISQSTPEVAKLVAQIEPAFPKAKDYTWLKEIPGVGSLYNYFGGT